MIKNTDSQMLLYRARLLLEEGENEAAFSALQSVHTEDEKQQRDVSYLLGWYYIQLRQWDDAIRTLSPLIEQSTHTTNQETLLERERLTLHLLRLGLAAVNLAHYEDAAHHFTLCLKVLHDRRVNLPTVRVRARYYLAMTCIMRGFPAIAIQHYEDALRLCRHYHVEEALSHIYHGLCEAYRHTGDLVKAYSAGQEALRLYEQVGDRRMEARMHNLLGQTRFLAGDHQEAVQHYETSLSIAINDDGPTMAMVDCAALADLRLAEKQLKEAKHYCKLALQEMKRSDDSHMRGYTYQIIGKVAYEDAQQAEGEQRQQLLEETISWFEQARDQLAQTQAYPDIAETLRSLAQTLEELGRVAEAIECWRAGYEVLSHRTLPDRVL